MQYRSRSWLLLLSIVLAACSQPATPLPTSTASITATVPAQSQAQPTMQPSPTLPTQSTEQTITQPTEQATPQPSSTSSNLPIIQAKGFAALDELQRPDLSEDYTPTSHPELGMRVTTGLTPLIMTFIGNTLTKFDLIPSQTSDMLPIKPIDNFLTQTALDQVIQHYQASLANTDWLPQPFQYRSPTSATLIFEHERSLLYVFMFTPSGSEQVFVSIQLMQANSKEPAIGISQQFPDAVFDANAIPIPSTAIINNDLIDDPAIGALIQISLYAPIAKLETFWGEGVMPQGYQILEITDSQAETFDYYRASLVAAGWRAEPRFLDIQDSNGLLLMRFIDNGIQILALKHLTEYHNHQTNNGRWLLGMSLIKLTPKGSIDFTPDPNTFAAFNTLSISTPPEQINYQIGEDVLLDTLLEKLQVNIEQTAILRAELNGLQPPQIPCNNLFNAEDYAFFISSAKLDQLNAFYDQKLIEQGFALLPTSSNESRNYGELTPQGYRHISIDFVERNRYNPQLSGTFGIIKQSSSLQEQSNPIAQQYHLDSLIEPINLPLMLNAPHIEGVSPHLTNRLWDWQRTLRYETHSTNCSERTLLNGIVIRIHPYLEQQPDQIYDQYLLGQGWNVSTISETYRRYTKIAQDNSSIHTINLGWEVSDLRGGENIQLIMIDSSITYR